MLLKVIINPLISGSLLLLKVERNLLYILKNISRYNFTYGYNFNFDNLKSKEEEVLKDFKNVQNYLTSLNKEIKELKIYF